MSHEPPESIPNHLIHEKSPYLLQHAYNPVDWYPWGDEAFNLAVSRNRPVFLSIGYSTCHWCHVMAHESFEDERIAAILNAHFIAIKVDREERPDIDAVYMTACQQMTGQGGWPLTIIMTPDKKPFFAGTYLPPKTRQGMTGLFELLTKVVHIWKDQPATLVTAADEITSNLLKIPDTIMGGTTDRSLLDEGYKELAASFDTINGGFGRAPKFPTPATLLFLLRYGKRTGSDTALAMVEETLEALRCGGIHDHIGGGFHRYATDARWRVPHFEKMLYDQALLLMAYTEAWRATKKPEYREVAEEVITYVSRDLTSPDGAFFSAEDADSPGGEGEFYLWTQNEFEEVLGAQDARIAAGLFNVSQAGNFVSPESGLGKNILYLTAPAIPPAQETATYESIRHRLFAHRLRRERHGRDEKIITEGNCLMIAALARASRAFENPEYYSMAKTSMEFIQSHLQDGDGNLLHRYCDGEAGIPAFAGDYAWAIRALIELYETGFEPAWLEEALALDQYLNNHFSDKRDGGYFITSDQDHELIVRKKEIYDGAVPSCNSIMLINLVQLSHLTGNSAFDERAGRLAETFAGIVSRSPSAYCAYLTGLDLLINPVTDVVIAGKEGDPVLHEMIRFIQTAYLPFVNVHVRSSERDNDPLTRLAPFTRDMVPKEGRPTAYACCGHTCSPPVFTSKALEEQLGKKGDVIRGS
jgi:uncharacterized protein